MHFPDARSLRSEFHRRGHVLVPELLERRQVMSLFILSMKLLRQCGTTVNRVKDGETLWYRVVTGERIRSEGSALFSLYSSPALLDWMRELADAPRLDVSAHLRSAVNVNCLHRTGQGYPWHRDAVPYTCLLFLTSLPDDAGGELLIRAADDTLETVRPRAGDLLVMDGTRCPHAVAPLTTSRLRVSLPMVYPSVSVERPGLDDHLYTAGSLARAQRETLSRPPDMATSRSVRGFRP